MAASKVLAVSTSAPRWVDMNGVRTLTSLVREPSPDPLHFGLAGPEGNALAVHTERVYAFPIERYAYWASELGLDGSTWPYCFWGENITLDQLSEDVIRVGDLLRFSGGAVLEATGPRIPCTKMAWRLGIPGGSLRRLTQTGGLGFYLRVLEPGIIGTGDTIEVSSPYPDNVTITDLARLHDRADHVELARLEAVVETPRIAEQSRELLLRVIEHGRDQERARQGRWTGWRPFIVRETHDTAPDVRSVRLEPADGGPVAGYRGGQFLPVRGPGNIVRTWSLSDYDERDRDYRLSVKKLAGGQGSGWVHSLEEGQLIDVRAPAGRFVIQRSPIRPVVLISAGIGVTPLLAMLKAYRAGRFVLPLLWLHSTQSGATHLFRDEVDEVMASAPELTRRVHYSQPSATDRPGVDFDVAGRIDKAALAQIAETTVSYRLAGRAIEINGRTREFYICGPAAFERDVRAWLLELGVAEHLIRSESFDPRERESHAPVIDAASVRFARSGLTARWQSESGCSLLDLAEQAGIKPDFGCRSGSCGACATPLLEGRIDYNPAAAAAGDVATGEVLLCRAQPATAVLVLDL